MSIRFVSPRFRRRCSRHLGSTAVLLLGVALPLVACSAHDGPFPMEAEVRVATAERSGGMLFVKLKPGVRVSDVLASDLFASLRPATTVADAASVCAELRSGVPKAKGFLGCEDALLDFGRGWRFRFEDRRVELADERHASGDEVRVHRVLRLFFPDRGVAVGEVFRLQWPATLRDAGLDQLVVADADRPFAEATLRRGRITAVAWMRG